jgi:hypothetical protein
VRPTLSGLCQMPRRRHPISAVRTVPYTLAKLLGDLSALSKGANAIVKRLARREAGRMTAQVLGKWFR